MKDLGSTKHILDMKISLDMKSEKGVAITRELNWDFFEEINMGKAKAISFPLASHFKLTSKQYPISEKKK